ncbi:LacI family DNA-binding transcriptional regulator [Synoicihabitans lomoniglobus]|uniref:LacI family DNA-binding transcriptional regulator n=1 Tax=Synoicihabitans lomoniglobus TaxID=2909285 RepID=A0AAF0CI74_9BACT|nr:LacI family transcriptional regulator [Opitutaceae bacterium LMO-M01]WED65072.1 LacI family DNA-binding transcriptional regulator [Opitutaceae bacterium LMO-M01]
MTLRELAKLADLSPSAISLALRDSPRIAAATKERVRALAAEHGYAPDARIVDMMRHLRKPRVQRERACFGVISFYDHQRPWEKSPHLTRIYEGMIRRATEVGYRLEPLWLKAPGLSLRRFREILEARGIEGLLSFGSPDVEQDFPSELKACAVVTVGFSIRTKLHRVTSRPYIDTLNALNQLRALGYRRPGLVLSEYEDARTHHSHAAAYLGWCEQHVGIKRAVPVLRVTEFEAGPFLQWRSAHQPDAIIFVHSSAAVGQLKLVLKLNGIRPPDDLGVAVLGHTVEGSGFAGMQQNQALMGAWAVELLAARIANRDFGIPQTPRVEMVESEWVDGPSLRQQP